MPKEMQTQKKKIKDDFSLSSHDIYSARLLAQSIYTIRLLLLTATTTTATATSLIQNVTTFSYFVQLHKNENLQRISFMLIYSSSHLLICSSAYQKLR